MISDMASRQRPWLALFLGFCFFISAGLFSPTTSHADSGWQTDQIIVHHSLEKVEALLTACKDYKRLFKYVTKSRPVSPGQCHIETKLSNVRPEFWIKFKLGNRSADADGRAVRYSGRMLDGNVKAFEVKLRLSKLGDRKTLVVMRMLADLGTPYWADSHVEREVRNVIRRALVKLSMRLVVGRY